jgi:CubicO group peptidase (beta-lactamase class C family)
MNSSRLGFVFAGLALSGATTLPAQQSDRNPVIDRIYAQWDRADSPGCTIGVLKDGRWLYRRGYGSANLDYAIPNGPDMVYYVGSDSKQFTAASIALLSLAGRISLDDDIRKYFPEMPDYGKPVTVRHLVHHTGGLRDIYTLMSLGGLRLEDVFTDDQAIALIARQKELNFAPGDDYLYSNSGYFLLAQLVKRVTGQSLRVFADSAIFKPLEMTRTHFHDDPGHVMKQRAMSYGSDGKGGYLITYIQNFDKIGAGGLYTTLEDLRKWDLNYYTKQVGGNALQRLIHTRGLLNKGDTLSYAFGNTVSTYRGLRTTAHGGALMGYRADIVRFPDEHFSVLSMCNLGSIDPSRLALQVADHYLGAKMGPVTSRNAPASAPPAPRGTPATDASLAGAYYSEEVDATYRIRPAAGSLLLDRPLGRTDTLMALPSGALRAAGLTLTFERDAAGRPAAFRIEAGRVRNIRFVRR